MIKVAVAEDNNEVSPHFGHCLGYRVAVIENGDVVTTEYIASPGHEPGLLPRLLADHKVSCIIAGGIGHRAQMLFAQHGIRCVTGVTGAVDKAISCYVKGTLRDGESTCDHDIRSEGTNEGGDGNATR